MVPSRYFPNRYQEWNFHFSNAYSVDIQKRFNVYLNKQAL